MAATDRRTRQALHPLLYKSFTLESLKHKYIHRFVQTFSPLALSFIESLTIRITPDASRPRAKDKLSGIQVESVTLLALALPSLLRLKTITLQVDITCVEIYRETERLRLFGSTKWMSIANAFGPTHFQQFVKPQLTLIFQARWGRQSVERLSLKYIDLVAGQLAPMDPFKLVCEDVPVPIDRSADQLIDVESLHNLQHISTIDLTHSYKAFPRDPVLPLEHFVTDRCDQDSVTLDANKDLQVYPHLKRLEITVSDIKEGGILSLDEFAFPALRHFTLRFVEFLPTPEYIESIAQACTKWSNMSTLTLILFGYRSYLEDLEPALETMRHDLRERGVRLALHVVHHLFSEDGLCSAHALMPFRGSLLQDLEELDLTQCDWSEDLARFPYGRSHAISLPSLRSLCMNIQTVEEARTLQWRMNCLLCPNLSTFKITIAQDPAILEHLIPLLWQLPCTCKWSLKGNVLGGFSAISTESMIRSKELKAFHDDATCLGILLEVHWHGSKVVEDSASSLSLGDKDEEETNEEELQRHPLYEELRRHEKEQRSERERNQAHVDGS